jgi:putative ABC transport system permease protein
MALGAAPDDVLSMVVRQGMRLAAIGILLGFASAVALTHLMASLLFQVSAFDEATFISGGVTLVTVVLMSSWMPARRASRVDPIIALRYE